jgi:hypothetical protein
MVNATVSSQKSDKMTRFDDEKQQEKTFEDAFLPRIAHRVIILHFPCRVEQV